MIINFCNQAKDLSYIPTGCSELRQPTSLAPGFPISFNARVEKDRGAWGRG